MEFTRSVEQLGAILGHEHALFRRRALSPSRVLAVREKAESSQAQFAHLRHASRTDLAGLGTSPVRTYQPGKSSAPDRREAPVVALRALPKSKAA